ncbi:hypothetical protein QTP70_000590 [Hemibagrus guttatus]|uniref:Reverse transcriptase n=1 Tax=Hemibagrus guttatus TaxID=175788 RepID=A0AAE0UUS3_9TELE|nr:hypothetical protein QTP70_000590 [Hemibagrus guttatus]
MDLLCPLSTKTSFYKEKLEASAQDLRKLHNIFSSLLNPPAPPAPSSLTAEDFATFYTEKQQKRMDPLDPIPSTMLQTISPDLLPFITTVINGSLTSGHVPTAFKEARVIPILKKPAPDPSDISNYRLLYPHMDFHTTADDTQLIFSFPPSDATASARISACLEYISSWMTAHQLKLNPSKTELLVIPATARNLGVTMDNQLSFSSHVAYVTLSCRFLLYNIRRIRPFLSTQATQMQYYGDKLQLCIYSIINMICKSLKLAPPTAY